MTIVRFSGWSRGLKKVQLTKIIRESASVSLSEAHTAVNRLLEGGTVDLQVATPQAAQRLVTEASALGAHAECVSTPQSSSPVS